MKKTFHITYSFLNTECNFETEYWQKFLEKLEYLDTTPEILQHSIRIWTEEK